MELQKLDAFRGVMSGYGSGLQPTQDFWVEPNLGCIYPPSIKITPRSCLPLGGSTHLRLDSPHRPRVIDVT